MKKYQGFTIVELLIVIVVIGILAALALVSYGAVQGKANDAAVQSDLKQFGSTMERYRAESGTYPSSLVASMGIRLTKSAYGLDFQSYNARYCYNPASNQFIFYARSKSGNFFRYISGEGTQPAADTYGWGICEQIGLTTTNPFNNGLYNTTWSSWVN